jgi:hypothetical protein
VKFDITSVVNMHFGSAYDIRVDRASIFGNPFRRGQDGDLDTVLRKYREYFNTRCENDTVFRAEVLKLRNKILGCWCSGPCHGMIIVEWLEKNKT